MKRNPIEISAELGITPQDHMINVVREKFPQTSVDKAQRWASHFRQWNKSFLTSKEIALWAQVVEGVRMVPDVDFFRDENQVPI